MFDLAFLEVLSIGWMTIILFCNCAPFINFRSSFRMKICLKRTILFFSNLIVFHSWRDWRPPLKKKSSSAKFVKCISLIGFRASRHSNSASWLRPAVIMGPFFIPSFLSYTVTNGYFDVFFNFCTFTHFTKLNHQQNPREIPLFWGPYQISRCCLFYSAPSMSWNGVRLTDLPRGPYPILSHPVPSTIWSCRNTPKYCSHYASRWRKKRDFAAEHFLCQVNTRGDDSKLS